jgi:hypothetical protein
MDWIDLAQVRDQWEASIHHRRNKEILNHIL